MNAARRIESAFCRWSVPFLFPPKGGGNRGTALDTSPNYSEGTSGNSREQGIVNPPTRPETPDGEASFFLNDNTETQPQASLTPPKFKTFTQPRKRTANA